MSKHKHTVMSSAHTLEPAYILHNGQSVPYIPKEITDHRTAYAATLHVLFKHVADFHICIVKVFSKKYGIPEDDIMQTIQESDEFKNMAVDPVLDPSDALGYLRHEDAHPLTATATVHEPEMKKIVKKKQPALVVVEPVVEPVVAPVVVNEPVKKKIIRKKVAPENPEMKEQTVIVVEPVVMEPVVVAPVFVEPIAVKPVVVAPVAVNEPVKKKIIRKKVAPEKQEKQEQETQEQETQEQKPQEQAEQSRQELNERNDHVPDILLIDHATTTKKIIRKKK